MQTKNILPILFFSVMTLTASSAIQAATDVIGKNTPALKSDLLTPEALWAFGRVGEFRVSPDGREAVYNVGYYSVEQNKGHHVLYFMSLPEGKPNLLTTDAANETGAVYIDKGRKLLFMSNRSGSSQLWTMNADGSERKQLSDLPDGIEGFLLSPDESKIIVIRQVESHSSIEKKYDDLPKATGMVINDMMYKHWDTFVTSVPHPFLADFSLNGLGTLTDLLDGEPYECPMLPFGGTEQLCWSPDSKSIAYTCRKKTGKKYAVSTDSDIFLYDIASGTIFANPPTIKSLKRMIPVRLPTSQSTSKRKIATLATIPTHRFRPTAAMWHGKAWSAPDMKATGTGSAFTRWQPARKPTQPKRSNRE